MEKDFFTWLLITFSFISTAFSQNVGIGLSNPTRAKLEVNGAVGFTVGIFGGEGNGISLQRNNPAIGFNHYYNAGDRYIANGYAAAQWFNAANGVMYFDFWNSGIANQNATGLTRALVLKPGGLVGIGDVNPNGQLQFPNALANRKIVLWEGFNNDHQYYGFGIESSTLRYAVDWAGASHKFYAGNNATSSTLLMTIGGNKKVVVGTQAGGSRVGINSGDPVTTLEIVQTANTGIALIEPLANYNYWEFKCWTSPFPNNVALYFYYNGAQKSFIYYGGGEYVSVSDSRLKKNEQALEPVLNKVMKLTPLHYQYKKDNPNNETSLGFFAQEVRPLFPELVKVVHGKGTGYNDIEDLHAINYSGFGVIAIKAIQEQQVLIEQLQNEKDKQQKQIDELRKRMEAVEREK